MNNKALVCNRCGWNCEDRPPPSVVENWPSGTPQPPLPETAVVHPVGHCVSPFAIGDKLFWNLDLADPDMPPLKVVFKELVEIQFAQFSLHNNEWVQDGGPRPMIASVTVDPTGVFPHHDRLLGRELLERELEVPIGNLVPEHLWPVIEVD